MLPIGSFILKTTAFCNLNCSYCYMFNLRDRSYMGRPKVMPDAIVDAAVERITAYCCDHELREIPIILHGGEPLLSGKSWMRNLVRRFQEAGKGRVHYTFGLQTNAVLIDAEWIELFRELRIKAAVSMDGPREIHNRARVNHAGKGSYDEVVRGLRLLMDAPDAEELFGGILCVIDPTVDGLSVYNHFREIGIKRMDFLLPAYDWDHLPPGHAFPDLTPFADYLLPIFESWWAEDNSEVNVRLFDEILKLIFGNPCHVDALGGDPINLAVIETDGSIEPLDILRSCGDGFTNLGLNVQSHPIRALYDQPLYRIAMAGQEGLSAECRSCALHDICGGGYLPFRYSRQNGFDNRNVHCRDLWKVITHMLGAMNSRLREPIAS